MKNNHQGDGPRLYTTQMTRQRLGLDTMQLAELIRNGTLKLAKPNRYFADLVDKLYWERFKTTFKTSEAIVTPQ